MDVLYLATRLNLEMMSYSDNGYDVTKSFCRFEKSWLILYSYQISMLSGVKYQSYTGEGG